jgi:hypothetical protein
MKTIKHITKDLINDNIIIAACIIDYPDYIIHSDGTIINIIIGKSISKNKPKHTRYIRTALRNNTNNVVTNKHALIYTTFHNLHFLQRKRKDNYVVDHINNDRNDNKLSNLQLVSSRVNNTKDSKPAIANNIRFTNYNKKSFIVVFAYRKNGYLTTHSKTFHELNTAIKYRDLIKPLFEKENKYKSKAHFKVTLDNYLHSINRNSIKGTIN